MLEINFEFRKGIFFVRLIGCLKDRNYYTQEIYLKKLILENKFRYVVINTNYLETVDLDGLNYLMEILYMSKINTNDLVICDKNNIFKRLLNDSIPSIKSEIEVL